MSKRQVVLPILLLGSLAGPGTSAAQAPTASASVTAAKSSAEQPAGLSLQQLVDEALRQSPAVGAASAGVEVARESVRFARTERLPRFDFSTGYDYLGPQGQLPMRGAVFDLSQLSGFRYNPSLFRFGVGFSVPVYSGGRIEATIGREEAGKGIADERLRLSKEELIEQVAATFYRILQLAEEIKAAEGSLASLRESQRILREQVEVGTAARVELLKVNTRVAAIEQALIQVHNGQEIARTQLSSLIGRERVANKVQVAGVLAYEPKPGELSQHLDLAIRQRPELRTQELAVSAERQTVKIARAGLLPTLSVNGL
ncbi:MAG: TolC family protein, partial [Acidobacteria bacterium]|nr:TolC family protein [Acidobacteriota bacterium]